jgi:hypothetical protein
MYWPVVFGVHTCEKIIVERSAVLKVIIVLAVVSDMPVIPDIELVIPEIPDISVAVNGDLESWAHYSMRL